MKPRRIQLQRTRGWRLPPDTVVVSRPGPWGNPFTVREILSEWGGDEAGAQAAAVALFRDHVVVGEPVHVLPGEEGAAFAERVRELRCHYFAHVHELRGKNLACRCRLGTPCHADLLLEAANR